MIYLFVAYITVCFIAKVTFELVKMTSVY